MTGEARTELDAYSVAAALTMAAQAVTAFSQSAPTPTARDVLAFVIGWAAQAEQLGRTAEVYPWTDAADGAAVRKLARALAAAAYHANVLVVAHGLDGVARLAALADAANAAVAAKRPFIVENGVLRESAPPPAATPTLRTGPALA